MEVMNNDLCFDGIVFKIDEVDGYVFKKMYVCFCLELVIFCLEDDINLYEIIGKYLELKDFYEVMK